jgi:hypothetical protein
VSRHSDYGIHHGKDCRYCYMYHLHKALGSICLYDEKSVQAGYSCGFYIKAQETAKNSKKKIYKNNRKKIEKR